MTTTPPRYARLWTFACVLVILLILAFSAWRASTQSLTHDEAYTALAYVLSPLSDAFKYSANNHVLNTFLMRVSVASFGLSEFSLRLPALLGAALYLSILFFILRLLFPPGRWLFLSLALASLNPLLLDFFSCARGYSLALAFLFAAILCFLRALQLHSPLRSFYLYCLLAGVSLSLSILANLAFLFVAVPVALSFFILSAIPHSAIRIPQWRIIPSVLFPALLILLCGYLPYFSSMQPAHFYLGYSTWTDSAQDILCASFLSAQTSVFLPADSPLPVIPYVILVAVAVIFLVLLLLVALPLLARILRRDSSGFSISAQAALLFSLSSLLALACYFFAHFLFNVKYPVDRSLIYLVPLVTLSLLAGFFTWTSRPLWLERIVLVLVLLVCICYLTELHPSYFRSWRYDADSRAVADKVQDNLRPAGPPRHSPDAAYRDEAGPVLFTGGWYYTPALQYYSRSHNTPWPLVYSPTLLPQCRFVLLAPDQLPALEAATAKFVNEAGSPIFTGPTSRVTLYSRP